MHVKYEITSKKEYKWASRTPGAETLSCRWRRRWGGSLIFYSWGFIAFYLLCQSYVCVFVCACAWKLQTSHLRLTHTYCTESTPDLSILEEKRESMPLWAQGVSVYGCTHIKGPGMVFMQGSYKQVGRVSSTVCNTQPTMYDPFVFCDRGRRKKKCLFKGSGKPCSITSSSTPTQSIHMLLTAVF